MSRPKKAVETILDKPPEPVVAEDITESPADPLDGPESDYLPIPEQVPAHPLDLAHVGAKMVVTTEGAMLATKDGVSPLPKTDPANRLPVGAKVLKTAKDEYMSDQLSANISYPARIYGTASEAIRNFVEDFHPLGLHS